MYGQILVSHYFIFFCMAAFLLMAVVCRIGARSESLFLSMKNLSYSAFFFAGSRFFQILYPLFESFWISAAGIACLLVSLFWLVLFYRSNVRRLAVGIKLWPGYLLIGGAVAGIFLGSVLGSFSLILFFKALFGVFFGGLSWFLIYRQGPVFFQGERKYYLAAAASLSLFFVLQSFDGILVFKAPHRDLILEALGVHFALIAGILILLFAVFFWLYLLSILRQKDPEEAEVQNRYGKKAFFLFLLLIFSGFGLTVFFSRYGFKELAETSRHYLNMIHGKVHAGFQESERLVQILSGSPHVLPALEKPTAENLEKAKQVFLRYAGSHLKSEVFFLVDASGKLIAGSGDIAYHGLNLFFRSYVQEALKGNLGRYLSESVVRGDRAYFVSYPVRNLSGRILGAVVIKKTLLPVEKEFSEKELLLMVSPEGVIFLSSRKEYLFQQFWQNPLYPLSAETAEQFGQKTFKPVSPENYYGEDLIEFEKSYYYVFYHDLHLNHWKMVYLAPMKWVYFYLFLSMVFILIILILQLAGVRQFQHFIETRRQISRSEKQFKTLFEQAPEGILMAGLSDLRILEANETLRQWLGYRREELTGFALDEMDGGKIPLLMDLARQMVQKGLVFLRFLCPLCLRIGIKAFDFSDAQQSESVQG